MNITAETGDAKQASDLANSVAESLSNVVEKSLYASGKESPVKLSVVQRAAEPISPSSPKVALYLAVGLVAGLILGVFATLIRDLMATRVEEASDLQDIINAPIMGRIPTDESLQSNKPIIVSNPAGRIAEEFRRIRTNLSFTSKVEGSDARMIVISSVGPSEGKTTVSVNVAAALAENGAKVLLIDADLRHPSVAERLSLEGGARPNARAFRPGHREGCGAALLEAEPAYSAGWSEAAECFHAAELEDHDRIARRGFADLRLRDHRHFPDGGGQ